MFGQTLHGVGGFDLVGLVVHDDQLDGTSEDGGRDLVGELNPLKLKLSGKGILSGQGHVDADLDRVGGLGGRGEAHAHGDEGECAQQGAEFHASILQL